jgi:putative peptide zinc metalloprotease protein
MSPGSVAPATLPAVRPDLAVVPRRARGKTIAYVVQDPQHHAAFELDEEEHFLLSRLDGRSTRDDVLQQYEARFGASLVAEDLDAFIRQLGEQQLLAGWAPRPPTLPEIAARDDVFPVTHRQLVGWRGDRVFGWLSRHLRWLFMRPVQYLFGAVTVTGLVVLVLAFGDLVQAVRLHGSPAFLVGLIVMSGLVHSVRALAHGVAYKHFGGQVPIIGVRLVFYVLPWLYCDYSGIRWLAKKSHRLWTIFAGLYFQIVLWAVAMVAWRLTAPGTFTNSLWLLVAVSAGGSALLVTANPFIPLAGYRLLTTWLEVPQLRERALAVFGAWATRRPAPEALTRRERRWFRIYGALAAGYFAAYWVLVVTVLAVWLTGAFQGAGAVATLVFIVFLFHRPLGRATGRLAGVRWMMVDKESSRSMRWVVRGGALALLIVVLLLPYPYETGGPFTIISTTRAEVTCDIDGGRVLQVFVREGEVVQPGQRLAQLDPREYERNVEVTRAQLAESEAKLQLLRKELALLVNPPNIESIHVLEAQTRRAQALLADYERQLELTTLRSPIAGRVMTPLIEQTAGKYLKRGDLFAVIEEMERVRVQIRVPEGDAPKVRVGAPVKVVAWAYPDTTFHATVLSTAPLALASGNPGQDRSVRAVAELDNEGGYLTSNITGYAKIRTETMPVWRVLSRLILRWLRVEVWYWIP